MQRQQNNHVDDDDDDFEDGVLKDGHSCRVKMFLRDGRPNPHLTPLQRDIAASGVRVTDASGGTIGLHRPGYRITANDSARQRVDDAHAEYRRQLQDAWRRDAVETTTNKRPRASMVDEREAAYAEYDRAAEQAWRHAR